MRALLGGRVRRAVRFVMLQGGVGGMVLVLVLL